MCLPTPLRGGGLDTGLTQLTWRWIIQARARIRTFLVGLSLLFALSGESASEQTIESLFQETKAALEAAQSVEASFFAPKNFAKALKQYRNAERQFADRQNAEAARSELALATSLFQQATETSRAAQAKFASVLKARADAESVKASLYASDLWQRGERELSKAISDFERDVLDLAAERASEAEQLYRDAELTTIKSTYLSRARLAFAKAEEAKVDKYAPKTLQKAKELMAQAESALEQDRYDADRPRDLVQQATYEVKHATYLAEVIKQAKDEKLSAEDLILVREAPLHRIAAAADMAAAFDSGYDKPARQIISYIENQQERSQRLEQDNNDLKTEIAQLQAALSAASEERETLSERLRAQAERLQASEQQVSSLRTEVQTLQLSLGGVSEERGTLSDRLASEAKLRENLQLEANTLRRDNEILEQMLANVSKQRELLSQQLAIQTRLREQVEKVESMFAREEARVLRQSGDIVIRLVGLNFAVGRSTIQPKDFALLAKLSEAIQIFPDSALTIEGHTDSHGGDAANLALSQKRADAVRQYLVANLRLDASRIEAVGYGETRPVANNETKEGRAKNRRIDVVISPALSSG